jgi:Spy/CpxP family protein refolding chaperone
MTLKRILIGAGLAVALPLTALAVTQGGYPEGFGRGHGGPRGELAFLHGIELTDSQKSQLHTIMQNAWKTTGPLEKQDRALHNQVREALLAPGALDSTSLASLTKQEAQLHEQIETARLNTAIQVRGLLTEDQISKAATVHQQLEALRQQERQLMGAPERAAGPAAEPEEP